MKNRSKLSAYLITAVVLTMCIAASAFFVLLQNTVEPENPLDSAANPSQMLLSSGGGLNVSENALEGDGSNLINRAEIAQATASAQEPTAQPETQPNGEHTGDEDSEQPAQPLNTQTITYENYVIPQIPNSSDTILGNGTAGRGSDST